VAARSGGGVLADGRVCDLVDVEGEREGKQQRRGRSQERRSESRMLRMSMPVKRWKAARSDSWGGVLVGGGLRDCWVPGLTGSSVAETCPEVLVSFMVVLRVWDGCGCSVSESDRALGSRLRVHCLLSLSFCRRDDLDERKKVRRGRLEKQRRCTHDRKSNFRAARV